MAVFAFKQRVFLKKSLWIYFFGSILFTYIWYRHVHSFPLKFSLWTDWYNNKLMPSYLISIKLFLSREYWQSRLLSWPQWLSPGMAFGFAVLGLFISRRLIIYYFIGIIVFLFFIGAFKTYHHDYWAYPLLPLSAMCIGLTLDKVFDLIKPRYLNYLFVILFVVLTYCFSINTYSKAMLKSPDVMYKGISIEQKIPKGVLVISVQNSGDSRFLYAVNRKGWIVQDKDLSDDIINQLKNQGARYLILWETQNDISHEYLRKYQKINSGSTVMVYKIE